MNARSVLALATIVLSTVAIPATAQERSQASYATEASVSYSVLRDVGESSRAGMVVDFGKQLKPRLSAIGEIAVNHFSAFGETYTQFAGGVRFGSVASSRVRPFAQVLVGVQREFGSNGLNVQPGAGLNLRIAKQFDARVQVDVPLLRWEGDSYRQFRLGVGIAVPLGR
jgi:hypothetical protein